MTKSTKPDKWSALDSILSDANILGGTGLPPDGSFTVGEYAAKYNIPTSTARTHLTKLARSGKIKTGKWYDKSKATNERCGQVNFYWVP